MEKKRVVVTGGLGYLGSHTTVALQDRGFEVIIIDNLSNSSIDVLDGIYKITGKKPEFHQFDLKDNSIVKKFFKGNNDLDGVIHFAASKAVGESVQKPLQYYENNLFSLINLLEAYSYNPASRLIFSSSCTVYGQAIELPITEKAPIKKAESPYGNTKQIGEEIIKDTCLVNKGFKAIALRYFNPIGAHESAKIGELPIGTPQNLVPFITQTAIGKREQLAVFGNDFPTKDGTAIRDYIHVMDLAEAHVAALELLLQDDNQSNYDVFNLGTGKGQSVLEVIHAFEESTGQRIPYEIKGRRNGDVTAAYADTSKANSILKWKAKRSLLQALSSAWNWENNNSTV